MIYWGFIVGLLWFISRFLYLTSFCFPSCSRARWYTPSWITQAAKTHSIRWSQWSTLTFVKTEDEPGTKKRKKRYIQNTVKYETSLLAALGKGGNISTGTELVQFISLSFFFCSYFVLWKHDAVIWSNNVSMCFVVKTKKKENTSWHYMSLLHQHCNTVSSKTQGSK